MPLLQPISLTPALEFPSQGPDFRHTFIRRPGIVPKTGYAHYTVRQAAEDWLATGLDGRSPKTIKKNQNVLEPIRKIAGARKLSELSAADVRDTAAFRVSSSASDTASAQEPSGGREQRPPLHEPGQAVDMTGRITRRQVVHGLINEYRRAA